MRNILIIALPNHFLYYQHKKFIELGIDLTEKIGTPHIDFFKKIEINRKNDDIRLKPYSRDLVELGNCFPNDNVDIFDLDARLIKKYRNIIHYIKDIDHLYKNEESKSNNIIQMFYDELETKFNNYDYILASCSIGITNKSDFVSILQVKINEIILKNLKEKFKAKIIVGGGVLNSNNFNRFLYDTTIIDCLYSGAMDKNHIESLLLDVDNNKPIKDMLPITNFPPGKYVEISNSNDYSLNYSEIFKLFDIPEPKNDGGFIKKANLVNSFGCPNKCAFCQSSVEKFQMIPFEILTEQILKAVDNGFNSFFFLDNSFNRIYNNKFSNWVVQKNLKIKWSGGSRCSTDKDFFISLYESGCRNLNFGFEIANDNILEYVDKRTTIEKIQNSLELSNDVGIWNTVSVIHGFPYSTYNDFLNTLKFMKDKEHLVQTFFPLLFYLKDNTLMGKNPKNYKIKPLSKNISNIFDSIIWEETDGRSFGQIIQYLKKDLPDFMFNMKNFYFINDYLLFALYDIFETKDKVIKYLNDNYYLKFLI